jgi:hypothetical protein
MFKLRFDNVVVCDLPGDAERGPHLCQVVGALYSLFDPTPVSAPRVLARSADWKRDQLHFRHKGT